MRNDGARVQKDRQSRLSRRHHRRRRARAGGAGALRCRAQGGHGRAHRAARRARAQARAHRLSRSRTASIGRTSITVKDAREGNFVGSEIPHDLQRQWIQGTGPAARPRRVGRGRTSQRRLRAAVRRRRLDVRRRGRARPGVDDVARQPAQSEAGDSSRSAVPDGRRAGRRRDEQVGDGLLRPADRHRLAQAARLHDQDLSRPRPASRRSPHPQRRRLRLLRLDRRRRALHRQQPPAADRLRRVDRPVSAEDPDRRRSGAVERHPDVARAASRPRRPARSRPTCSSSRSKRASS